MTGGRGHWVGSGTGTARRPSPAALTGETGEAMGWRLWFRGRRIARIRKAVLNRGAGSFNPAEFSSLQGCGVCRSGEGAETAERRRKDIRPLGAALRGSLDPEKFEALRGTVSLPFKAGKENRIAVKVIDMRGNEVVRLINVAGEKGDR